jgi:hypothetical protein
MAQQTAVEWLQEVIINHLSHEQQMQLEGLFQQAKQMEKAQIINAYEKGAEESWDAEKYYHETYESKYGRT